ncbi:DUF3592 domain-containing protein [Fodinibius salsisoli]|uniref:DUF3592 domain-containing protein n=1 Tax=Fodinibius salsisoli TaxID=2820877 RepID=A0ABT3PPU9_9BACT|nr:DUF3592 domain-containing protein [Fodinibius salsisoli]
MKIVKYVFSLVGLGLLVGAFFWYNSNTAFLEKAITAEGTVVDLVVNRSSDSRTYSPVVEFLTQEGESIEFVSRTSSNPPSYSRGERVEVLYLLGEPRQAKINGFFSLWGGILIVGGLGLIFFLVGAALVIVPIVKGRKDEQLRNNGYPIKTKFQRIELNESYSVNGRHPFQLITQWQDPSTSQIHVFRSNNLWFDPTDYIDRDRITVFIEKDDPETYYMDISFLPELAE